MFSDEGASCIDWAQLSRLLPEDGDLIQSQKRCVLNMLWNPNFHYHAYKSPPEPDQCSIHYLIQSKINFNIIIPRTSALS
jgi:hypothetical protein